VYGGVGYGGVTMIDASTVDTIDENCVVSWADLTFALQVSALMLAVMVFIVVLLLMMMVLLVLMIWLSMVKTCWWYWYVG